MTESTTKHLLKLATDENERLRASLTEIVRVGVKRPPPSVSVLVALASDALKGKRAMRDEKRSPPRKE